jgi:glutathione S-transferase
LFLYEEEGCPYSRKAREALSMLDLDAEIRPCPLGARHHLDKLKALLGHETIPVLIDPNTNRTIDDSDAIVTYLFRTYGNGRVPPQLARGATTDLSSKVASALRVGRQGFVPPASLPKKPLELYGYEGSPYCRLVREVLSRHAFPYRLHNVARGSPKRPAFIARAGKMQVPFLHDPNTGFDFFETCEIEEYLRAYYVTRAARAQVTDPSPHAPGP